MLGNSGAFSADEAPNMIVPKANGTEWRIEQAPAKLALRAKLPGARVFDLVAESLRQAKSAGVPALHRLPMALPASWCVNSPAPSTLLRRWALPPQREVWLSLVAVFEEPRTGALDPESREAILIAMQALGSEAIVVEAASKVLALLVPDAVPLMPPAARAFVLGTCSPENAEEFVAMIDWFSEAVARGGAELAACARGHAEVLLSAAQALDRLLWFDSEGYRHFPGQAGGAPG
jgi:hypothetical protein